jgi:predicted Zn-dependent protease
MMRIARIKKYLYPALLLGVMVLLCNAFLCVTSTSALTVEDGRVLGREFLIYAQKHLEFVKDDYLNEAVNDFGRYLLRSLETKHFPYRVYIIKSYNLNAFAAPGGHILIHSGLIDVRDETRFDPAAMIAVLNKLQRGQPADMSPVPSYLLTHSTGPERMSNLDSLMSGYQQKPKNPEMKRFRSGFPFLKTVLSVKTRRNENLERMLQGELRKIRLPSPLFWAWV